MFLPGFIQRLYRGAKHRASPGRQGQGLLVFAHTGEVIRAEALLRTAGLPVSVQGPPPALRTGCDMVVVFPLMLQPAALEILAGAGLRPERIATADEALLEPVALFSTVDLGDWIMVRAANLKITIRKADRRIVNISGGGCPDVPYLAAELKGQALDSAPEPRRLGQTLCCYSLQKAFEEAKRLLCG